MRAALLLFVPLIFAFGQDERLVVSPDGQIQFLLFVAPQEGRALSRLAFSVSYKGKPVVEASYLGLDIWDQEPLLGENIGLISSTAAPHSLLAKYMQNGSLGRLLNVEVRVFDDGVAFRYIIPRSLLLKELLIADEATEFALTGGEVAVTEIPISGYPAVHLAKSDGSNFITRLERNPDHPSIAFQGTTPYFGPWRVVVIGPESKCPAKSKIVSELKR